MRETPLVWQVRHTETNAHWSHELKSLFLQRWGEEPFSDSPFCFLSWSSLWTTSSLSSSTWQHQEIKHTHLQTELKNIQKHQPGKYPQPGNLENYYKQIKQRRPHGVHVLQDRSGVYQSQINTPNKWHHLQFKRDSSHILTWLPVPLPVSFLWAAEHQHFADRRHSNATHINRKCQVCENLRFLMADRKCSRIWSRCRLSSAAPRSHFLLLTAPLPVWKSALAPAWVAGSEPIREQLLHTIRPPPKITNSHITSTSDLIQVHTESLRRQTWVTAAVSLFSLICSSSSFLWPWCVCVHMLLLLLLDLNVFISFWKQIYKLLFIPSHFYLMYLFVVFYWLN